MVRTMDWFDLRYLLATARSRSFSGAATQLGVTHTTVSRRLQAVEEQLGVRLFDRTPKGLLPTPVGEEVIELAERVESDVLGVQSRLMGLDAQLRGDLRVSMVDYLFWGMHEAFAAFLQRYPHVDLTLTATNEMVSLPRRDADVALRLTDAPPENLIGRRLGTIAFSAYASSALVEARGPDAAPGDLPWLGWDERTNSRWYTAWLAEHAPGAKIVLRLDENPILRRRAVSAGIGAFLLPCFEGDSLPGVQRICDVELSRSLWMLTLPELRHTGRVRAFIDHMVEVYPSLPAMGGAENNGP